MVSVCPNKMNLSFSFQKVVVYYYGKLVLKICFD
jgi:hypothetical protein